MRRQLGVLLVALALAAVTVPTAGATDGVLVNVIDCAANGGSTAVPSGTLITIEGTAWAAGSYGLIKNFLLKQHTTLTISNETTTVLDLSNHWETPQEVATTFWLTGLPNTDPGIALAPGQSIVATFDITFTQPLADAFPPVGPSGDNGPFLFNEAGPFACLITGT